MAKRSVKKVKKNSGQALGNIMDELNLSEKELKELGQDVVRGYKADDASRSKWKAMHASWLKLFSMQRDPKTAPWKNCSNIGLPVLTTACIQYHANAYPSLLPPKGIVKGDAVRPGADARDIADRKAKYTNFYLSRKSKTFMESMDTTQLKLPVEGTVIRKQYYDSIKKIVITDWISPMNFVISNDTRYLEDAERYTHVLSETENAISKKGKAGFYQDVADLGPGKPEDLTRDAYVEQQRKNVGYEEGADNDDNTLPRMILEQYIYRDFGESDVPGTRDPYIVVVDEESERVIRISRRKNPETKKPINIFTKYGFIKNPAGFYDYGFGLLLDGTNKAMNSILNQLIDSGSLQNLQTGFVNKASGMARGVVDMLMGGFKEVDLRGDDIRKEVLPFKFGPPSQVLFAMLGFLQQNIDKLTTVTELKTGALPKSDTSATAVTALIEEGQRVFSVIHQRNHRAFSQELDTVHDLIGLHLDVEEYFDVVINPEVDMVDSETGEPNISKNEVLKMLKADWKVPFRGLALVSDPNITSRQEKVAKAQFLYETTLNSPVTQQNPENILNAQKTLYKAMDIDEDIAASVTQVELDEGPPNLPQDEEIQIFLKDGMVDALETQDHNNHLQVIEEFEQSEFFTFLTPIGAKNLDLHKRQHIGFLYAQTVGQLNAQDEQAAAQQPPSQVAIA